MSSSQDQLVSYCCQSIVIHVRVLRLMQTLKITAVGDGAAGKTSLFLTYINNAFPKEYIPGGFETYSACALVDGQPINLQLRDTPGTCNHRRCRIFTCMHVQHRPQATSK